MQARERWGRPEGAGDRDGKWTFSKPHPSPGFISYKSLFCSAIRKI